MKRIALLSVLIFIAGGVMTAQNRVCEQDVDTKYVTDFQQQQKGATDVVWYKIDDNTYRVDFTHRDGDPESILFGIKGSETHFHIPADSYPSFVLDTLRNNPEFAGYRIDRLYARKSKKQMTYQVRIVKTTGFLWWKKDKNPKLVNFETDGKFIDAVDE